jgi:hypothetical protein
MGFDPAEFGILDPELDGADAGLFKKFRDIRPGFGHELVGEEVAVSVNDAQAGSLVSGMFHKKSAVSLAIPGSLRPEQPKTGKACQQKPVSAVEKQVFSGPTPCAVTFDKLFGEFQMTDPGAAV